MSQRHTVSQIVVLIMPGPNHVRKPKSKHNATLYLDPSTHSVLHVLTISQPLPSPPSVSPTPLSLSHAATASTLSPPPRPRASPSLLSTNTIKSYWAMNHYSAGHNHSVSNPLVATHSSSFVPSFPHFCSHIHHHSDAGPHP